ncbi:MAG: hypothetical protein RSD67_01170 [Oscillospiraceae bacterium]
MKYYDNVVDAVRNCKYSDKQYKNFSEENILVLEENDNACVVLANINDKNDAILYYELNKKFESNKIFYSPPISAGKSSWKANKMDLHGTFLVKDTMNLNEKIIDDLKTFSNDFLGKNQLSFWGIADDERLLNLKINGFAPTKVIETKMDGDTVYLWYYKHLEVDLNNTKNIKIEF